jgi:hypothetical protein
VIEAGAGAAPAVTGTTNTPAENQNDLGQPINAGWRDALPETIRGEKTLAKFKDAGALAQSYIELEKMPRGVAVPKDDAKPEEWAAYYDKIGRPKDPSAYAVNVKVPEGMPWSKEAEANILVKLHDAGLTTRQAEKVINGYIEIAAKGNLLIEQAKNQTRQEAENTMKGEWGGLADTNIALVQRSVAEFGGDEFRTYLDDTGLGNDPRFMRFVHAMAQPMLEDGLIRGEGLGMKRAEAAAEINRLMKDPKWAAGDKDILARIADLYPLAHGGDE